jgi:hypothetical protein
VFVPGFIGYGMNFPGYDSDSLADMLNNAKVDLGLPTNARLSSVQVRMVEEYLQRSNQGVYDKKGNIKKEVFKELIAPALKAGAHIEVGTSNAIKILNDYGSDGAEAMCFGNRILFRESPTVSAILEETYHFWQLKLPFDKTLDANHVWARIEVEAGEWLLTQTEKYKIPDNEVQLTRENLRRWKEILSRYE